MVDVFSAMAAARPQLCAAALAAARALGVIDALPVAGEGVALDDLARALGLGAPRLRALLDVLALDGHAARAPSGWRRGEHSSTGEPLGAAAGWGDLARVLREDRPVGDELALAAAGDTEGLARFHRHLVDAGKDAATVLAARIEGRSLLDAGGGMGGYAAAFLESDPARVVTLIDRAPVLALARTHLAPFGDRARFVEGEIESALIPDAGYDAALLANVLHLHPREACARIVERCASSLREGGTLYVKDLAIADNRSGPPAAVLFALTMAIYTEGGDVHTSGAIAEWMRAADLVDVRVESLGGEAMVVRGRRRD